MDTPSPFQLLTELSDIIPFAITIDPTAIAGCGLWTLALYISLSTQREWLIQILERWLNFAERSLYTSSAEFDKNRVARESQNAFYASLLSLLPFILFGSLSHWGVAWSLGQSWAFSTGILACFICGIYELGRQSAEY
ncbi:MAG: hypothetical protein AAGG02_11435 [Cyanobacteria bacterium P01_H01_bin.15]